MKQDSMLKAFVKVNVVEGKVVIEGSVDDLL